MSPRLRLTLAVTTLALSIGLIAWGLIPMPRMVKRLRIPSSEIQVPGAVDHLDADQESSAIEHPSIELSRVRHVADYVILNL
jgi:hypothetical protein